METMTAQQYQQHLSSGASEAQIQNNICEYFASKGYFFWRENTVGVWDAQKRVHRKPSKWSMNGKPDIVVFVNGVFWGLEVKKQSGRRRKSQIAFEQLCIEHGVNYRVVRSLDDVIDLGL